MTGLKGIPADTGEGHNLGVTKIATMPAPSTNARLKSFISRIERLTEEKQAITDDIKEVFGELKSDGFYPAIVRQVLKERKKEANVRQEQMSLFDVYWDALR